MALVGVTGAHPGQAPDPYLPGATWRMDERLSHYDWIAIGSDTYSMENSSAILLPFISVTPCACTDVRRAQSREMLKGADTVSTGPLNTPRKQSG
jgi:hypothetical protein